MKIFYLPDLGEGLPDAIIREWFVKEGDSVELDQPLVSMETAKALVDVPSPVTGKIEKLFGKADDTIETGQPLVGFKGEGVIGGKGKDSGTVVGAIEESSTVLKEAAVGITPIKIKQSRTIRATPAVRALAKKLNVDLQTITPTGAARISADEVRVAASKHVKKEKSVGDFEKLTPVRRAMVLSMTESHQQVAPVTLSDDADIHNWDEQQNMTIRTLRAIQKACETIPLFNAQFNAEEMTYKLNDSINIGIAVDTEHGLYVPVIKNIVNLSDKELRDKIDQYKQQALAKSIHQDDLHGATIMLSNFGVFAGRYANPLIIPPMVSIVGVGRAREAVMVANGSPAVHRILPLSVTIDHRIITGGEAARFLRLLIDELEKRNYATQ